MSRNNTGSHLELLKKADPTHNPAFASNNKLKLNAMIFFANFYFQYRHSVCKKDGRWSHRFLCPSPGTNCAPPRNMRDIHFTCPKRLTPGAFERTLHYPRKCLKCPLLKPGKREFDTQKSRFDFLPRHPQKHVVGRRP